MFYKSIFNIFRSKPKVAAPNQKIGSKWMLRAENGDPFPPKDFKPVEVLDVKDGWVRYRMNRYFDDERISVGLFLSIYREVGQ